MAKKSYILKIYSKAEKNPFCPKCGKGVFMGVHKDRKVCGKCGYTEFTEKS